jgi:hypothetical protein
MGIHYSRHVRSRDVDMLKEMVRNLEAEKVIVTPEHAKKTPEEVLKRLKHNFESFSEEMLLTQLFDIPPDISVATYLIFEGSEVIYVGESGRLRGRLRDLLSGKHKLCTKLKGKFRTKDNVLAFLKEHCKIRYSSCVDKVEAQLLEKFCICVYSPKYND